MRRILFLLIMGLSAIAGNAQDNHLKFFEDGKSWICTGYNSENKSHYQFKVSVVGDTVVGGVTARKLQSEMLETGEKSVKYQVGYEADGKVYIWLNDGFRVFFDFVSLGPEKAPYQCDYFGEPILFDDGSYKCIVIEQLYSINIEGYNRKIYSVNELWELGIHYWIEGIGELDGFFLTSGSATDPFWNYIWLDECYLYDSCIYRADDFYRYPKVDPSTDPELSSIMEIGADEVNEAVYDLMGRKVTHPQPGHIYITPSGKRVY